MKTNDTSTLVYSSEGGRVTANRKSTRAPSASARTEPADGTVRLRREVKGRGGGTVIVITGIPGDDATVREIASRLKKICGCGGTVKDGTVEIQGDHRDRIMDELKHRGFKVKLSGG